MPERLTALVVMSERGCAHLLDQLQALQADVRTAASCAEAFDLLRDDPDVTLVLTDLYLSDGNWSDVLRQVRERHANAKVVVCLRVADERLWTQVLEAGGFDALVEPYQESEVRRILHAAAGYRNWAVAS